MLELEKILRTAASGKCGGKEEQFACAGINIDFNSPTPNENDG